MAKTNFGMNVYFILVGHNLSLIEVKSGTGAKTMEKSLLTSLLLMTSPGELPQPSPRPHQSFKNMPTSQSGRGSLSIVVLSTQVTLLCVELTK